MVVDASSKKFGPVPALSPIVTPTASFCSTEGIAIRNPDRGMALRRSSAALKALPITLKEFSESLSSAWSQPLPETNCPTTLGLAISGGVDSMALASLCARVQRLRPESLKFRAFVVDHGARAGSSGEAEAVRELVESKGIDTQILKIQWPKDITPSESSNFESLARHYRFRVLGEACRDSNTQCLLLAHHEDDYYETILMRLAGGHRGAGLLGIRPNARIPECYGLYNIYDSGATVKEFQREPLPNPRVFKKQRGPLSSEHSTNPQYKPTLEDPKAIRARLRMERYRRNYRRGSLRRMQLESGGVRVLRPLLQYSKERLVATCLQDGTSWFEDHTNADPTLTPRNSIRYICKQHSLPAALQKDSIIALSTSLQERKDLLETEALALLNDCTVQWFEPRAGSLLVRFPKLRYLESEQANGEKQKGMGQHQWELARRLVKYAIEAVSPYEHIQNELEQACTAVFPELNVANDLGDIYTNRFTIAGVMFSRKKVAVPVRAEDATSGGGLYLRTQEERETVPMQESEWLLSRQPYASTLEKQPSLEYHPTTTFKDNYGEWKLYDGRYWIRVFNHSFATIKIRPLRKSDLLAFRQKTSNGSGELRHRIRTIAPGNVRFTMPVIVIAAGQPGEKDEVLALPTLGVEVLKSKTLMDYEIRYKKVEWPLLQSGTWDKATSIPPLQQPLASR